MRAIRILLFIGILFLVCFGYSQPRKVNADSIARLLSKAVKEDTVKAKLMIEYANCFLPSDLNKSLSINKEVIELSKKIGYKVGIIRGLNGSGSCYWYQNKSDLCITSYREGLELAIKIKNPGLVSRLANNLGGYYHLIGYSDSAEKYQNIALVNAKRQKDRMLYARVLSELGLQYYEKGNYVDAIQSFIETSNIYDSLHEYAGLESAYNRTAMIFYEIRDFNKGITEYRLALKINKITNNVYLRATILQNIGLLYLDVASNFDSARIYLTQALQLSRDKKIPDTELSSLTNLGNLAFKQKDYFKAIQLYDEVYHSPLIQSRNKIRAGILVNLGTSYYYLGDLTKAEGYTLEGLKLAKEQEFVDYEKNACQTLGNIMTEKKKYKEAIPYFIRCIDLSDTLGSEEVKHKIAESVFQNSLQQKDNENLLLQKDNEIKIKKIEIQRFYIFLVCVVLLLGIVLMLILIRNSHKEHALNQMLDKKNKELEDLNLTKDKFYSVIAHDLKAPFNGLLGLLGELDENYDAYNEEFKRKILSELKISSHNTYNLLVNLLDWTLSQQGQIKYLPLNTSLHEVCDEVFTTLASRATTKNQILINHIDSSLIAFIDPHIFKSVLLNLVNNAIKFTPEDGFIKVNSTVLDEKIKIEVCDTGIGIPKSGLDQLFRIDTKFLRSGTAKEPGTGLGLVMCKEFVAMIGGEIGVMSEEEKGSVFYFTIPYQS